MHVELLVEEPSAKAALDLLVPRLLTPGDSHRCWPHRGKDELLARLPALLKSYARRFEQEPELRVVILVDADRDCRKAKQQLEKLVADAGLLSKTSAGAGQRFRVITRLAIAELEAWFLSDRAAICAAFPRVRAHHFKGSRRNPEELTDTWEALHRVLQHGGYYPNRYLKVEAAEKIAAELNPAANTSPSFHCFCEGLAALR